MLGVRGNKSEGDPGRVGSSESNEVKRKAFRLACEDVLDTSAELKESSAAMLALHAKWSQQRRLEVQKCRKASL